MSIPKATSSRAQADEPSATSAAPWTYPNAPSYIVGVGASAGGLEALERFLKAMPPDSGMAFVVIQHLSPDFKSLMDELLARHTTMEIRRVEAPTEIVRDTVYLLPPRKEMTIIGRTLHVQDRPHDQALSLPINLFFRSLAREVADRAIAVVLSGTGTDGTAGLIDVHDMGGLVLVQSEETAKFTGMPRSAIDTGLADAILAPEEMPATLMAYSRNPAAPLLESRSESGAEPLAGMPLIIERLRDTYGIDFNYYKPATISRRIDRRIAMSNDDNFQRYSERISSDPAELEHLYKDLLIGVTRFFRDPEAFGILQTEIIPEIVAEAGPDEEIRIWVPGCATGEEPYSLAMLFHEHLSVLKRQQTVRIFASDVHRESLQTASEGIYPESSLEELSPDRRARYFTREGRDYRIHSDLRKMLIFSPHNLIKDPPFTKMDLVSCRNLLIYFQPPAQLKALSAFHFALKLQGVLFLGPSEGPGELADEFTVIDRPWKLYRKIRDARLPLDVRLSLAPSLSRASSRMLLPGDLRLSRAYESLLNRYVPTGVLLNDQREVLHVFGEADLYLRAPSGRMTQDVLGMVRGDLRIALSSAIQSAAKRSEKIIYRGVRQPGREGEGDILLNLTVDPLHDKGTNSTYFYVMFEEERRLKPIEPEASQQFEADAETYARIQLLEGELQHTRESLQSTVEELETSNEELQSSNEELLAANEELQSTNEELHSVNEELYSVNAEHEQKIRELVEATNDLNNLIRSTEIGTVFLDTNHRIHLYTPVAARIFNLLPQDVGRDIRHITYRVRDDDIVATIDSVSAGRGTHERNVVGPNGRTYLRRVAPYWDENNKAAGVVITFVDITQLLNAERQLQLSEYSVHQASVATLWFDSQGRVIRVNRAGCSLLGYGETELIGRSLRELGPDLPAGAWDEEWLQNTTRESASVEATLQRKDGIVFPVELDMSRVAFEGHIYGFAFARDITDRKRNEHALRRSEQLYRSTFDVATVGLAHLAPDGRFLKVNQRLCAFLGYTAEELLDLSEADLALPEDRRLATGRLGLDGEVQKRYVRKDGRIVWGQVHGTVIADDTVSGSFTLCVFVDITQQKHAETSLRQSEERFRGLVESGPQAMMMVNASGRIMLVNQGAETLFGYTREELVGRSVESLVPVASVNAHQRLRSAFHSNPHPRVMGQDRLVTGLHKDGHEIPLEIGLSALRLQDDDYVLAMIVDNTERRRTAAAMQESLREKETLLKEIHHRVKNNMQLISSLLRLQADYVTNTEALAVFSEAQSRVRSMALIHEKLYQASSLARIEFSEYVESLVGILMQTYAVKPSQVTVDIAVERTELSVDTAVPLGLVVNELISNCLKHAFAQGQPGTVKVSLRRSSADRLELTVRDDGRGFPIGFNWRQSATFGLHLVSILSEQLQGTLDVTSSRGVAFSVTLPYAEPARNGVE